MKSCVFILVVIMALAVLTAQANSNSPLRFHLPLNLASMVSMDSERIGSLFSPSIGAGIIAAGVRAAASRSDENTEDRVMSFGERFPAKGTSLAQATDTKDVLNSDDEEEGEAEEDEEEEGDEEEEEEGWDRLWDAPTLA